MAINFDSAEVSTYYTGMYVEGRGREINLYGATLIFQGSQPRDQRHCLWMIEKFNMYEM